MTQEQRSEFERALGRIDAETPTRRPTIPAADVTRPRRVPSWWRGEVAAARTSIEAARQLGFTVMESTN